MVTTEHSESSDCSRKVGMHVSISGSLSQSVDRAKEIGCLGTFQIFTCSPRKWEAADLKTEETELFHTRIKQDSFEVFAHMPYLPNLASPDNEIHTRSMNILVREITRCDKLGVSSLVLHFGSHMGTSVELGQIRVVQACRKALEKTKGQSVRLLLENSAGVKNSVGSEFPFIKRVINEIDDRKRIGVCFDTCHAFASGYDLRKYDSVASTIKQFDREIGLHYLRLIHLNDSKGKLGDGKDRHENIGLGQIGMEGMKAILSSRELQDVPLILETPVEKKGDDRRNIETVKKLISKAN